LIGFQEFPGPALIFQDISVLENARIKFQDFSGFLGPIRTLHKSLLHAKCQMSYFRFSGNCFHSLAIKGENTNVLM